MAKQTAPVEVVPGEGTWVIEQFNFQGASLSLVKKDANGMQIAREDYSLQNVNLNFNDKKAFSRQLKDAPWIKELAEKLISEMLSQPAPDFTEADAASQLLTDLVVTSKKAK